MGKPGRIEAKSKTKSVSECERSTKLAYLPCANSGLNSIPNSGCCCSFCSALVSFILYYSYYLIVNVKLFVRQTQAVCYKALKNKKHSPIALPRTYKGFYHKDSIFILFKQISFYFYTTFSTFHSNVKSGTCNLFSNLFLPFFQFEKVRVGNTEVLRLYRGNIAYKLHFLH